MSSDKPPKLSLVICSRNRASALRQCLDALKADEMREVGGELILVNNGSTDETEVVMRSFKERAAFPVAIVHEPHAGLSRARNAGLATARGEVIVFSDDDCYLAPGYLTTASRVFESARFDYCGGRIFLYDQTDADYGCNRRETFELIPPRSFIRAGTIQGTNMVFRRKVVETIGEFDLMFGPGTPFRGDDIDYCARASRAGFMGAHVPELLVYHHHGRKPGTAEFEKLKAENDYARGAYFTKFILLGDMNYLKNWLKRAMKPKRLRTTLRELRGGYRYLLAR